MPQKNMVKKFRCTEEEAEWLEAKSKERKMNVSEYIRRKVFRNDRVLLPATILDLLKKMNYYNLKIGTNINQIVRSCNSKKFITKEDYQLLVQYLEEINGVYLKIYDAIEQIASDGICWKEEQERSLREDGSNEAAADQRDERKQSGCTP